MRRSVWMALLLVSSAAGLVAQAAPEGTPERAIQDMALAKKAEDIEKHLPVATLDEVKTLDGEGRSAFEASLLWREGAPGNQSVVEIPEDGQLTHCLFAKGYQ